MPRKKTFIRKSRRMVCDACGKVISKKNVSVAKIFEGFTYHFDSDDCLLIFKKLRAMYGKNFFRKLSA
jgi:YHS domain-containing protein